MDDDEKNCFDMLNDTDLNTINEALNSTFKNFEKDFKVLNCYTDNLNKFYNQVIKKLEQGGEQKDVALFRTDLFTEIATLFSYVGDLFSSFKRSFYDKIRPHLRKIKIKMYAFLSEKFWKYIEPTLQKSIQVIEKIASALGVQNYSIGFNAGLLQLGLTFKPSYLKL